MPTRTAKKAAVYVAATRQHVGKTSTCLGLLQGLTSRIDKIGFLKPVGQQSVLVNDGTLRVDKDVAVAKEIFHLSSCRYEDMSPVVIPPGYTREFLDGKITLESQLDKIRQSFEKITAANDYTIVEGTGHTGVGSIVDINNARVAAELGIDMVLIANGGIGSAFDDLALNYALCKDYGVKVRGVILNKVRPDKMAMVSEYFPKALKQWGMPLIGVVPNLPSLENQSMLDFEGLFKTRLLSAPGRRFQQYTKTSLVTSGLRRFLVKLSSNKFNDTLFVTHASRNDIILGFLSHSQNYELKTGEPYNGGLILTGEPPVDQPQDYIMEIIQRSNAPVLYAPVTTFEAMEKITRFTANSFRLGDISNPLGSTMPPIVKINKMYRNLHSNTAIVLNNHHEQCGPLPFLVLFELSHSAFGIQWKAQEDRLQERQKMEVRGVTFDLDDTLWCGKKVILKANGHFHAYLQTRLPTLSAAFPPAAFDALLGQFMRELPDHAHDYTFLRKHTLRHCIQEVGARELQLEEEQQLEALLEEAFQAFLIPRSQPEFFLGVDDLLLQLELHLRQRNSNATDHHHHGIDSDAQAVSSPSSAALLGVITNGNCVLEQLPDYFKTRMNFMISAEQVGKAKPSLEIFDAAMANFPATYEKAHIVHVGDHYECDVVGAKKAGLRTIWVNAKWGKSNVLSRRDLDLEDADKYSAADAIVKDVNAVLDVVTLWNKEAEQQRTASA